MNLLCLLIALTLSTPHAQDAKPAYIAGTGRAGYSGDGLQAKVAQLKVPSDVFVTRDGTVYIADTGNDRIRRITPDGVISTVAGNGKRAFTPDGRRAEGASISSPSSVVVDGAGSVYFTEWTEHRVRKVGADGILSTIAGTGAAEAGPDGFEATESALATPARIFLDGQGRLYIAEWEGNRVRVIGDDGIITTVAGSGERGFDGDGGPATEAKMNRPNGLFVTPQGDIYISDLGNNRVRKVDSAGVITTVAGNGDNRITGDGGPATEASLNAPAGLFVDDGGNLYIADTRNKKVRRVDPSGTIESWVHGIITKSASGQAERKPLRNPGSVFVDGNGHIYVADGSLNVILRVPGDATPTNLAVTAPGTVGFTVDRGFWQSVLDLF